MKLPAALRITALLLTIGLAAPAFAEESTLKEGAKDVGRAVGTAAREVGDVAKKVGKGVAEAAKEVGEAAKEGAKETKRAMQKDK
ncbi:hypothetical protein GCM10011487_63650 [Steroidobacter agaridevorans]|uniref:Uncharacterized protein n=1 Tax=Steroidobacter agaridevorans TaxID=2695856 RepID=A0A829YM32_9GAMM|nr:hypothetical protein [Steroidobacter agaridevorans]GFE84365.1 hypothetical protein GCM10011487_63650 [Steroidobacter agaridevorans]GFE87185.1 hypothetical protein GCM10011488_21390 [Steroidobacter agaridevorans]